MPRKLLLILALLAVGGLVLLAVWRQAFDWGLFVRSLADVRPVWILASIVVYLLGYVIRAWRWQVLLSEIKIVHFEPLLGATLAGFSTIYLVGRAGELTRPVWLARREGVPLSASLATIIVERFLDSLMLVGLLAATAFWIRVPETGTVAAEWFREMKTAAGGLAIVAVGVLAGLAVFHNNVDRIVDRFPLRRVAALLHDFSRGLSFMKKPRHLAAAVGYSLLLWGSIAFGFWLLLVGLRIDLGGAEAVLVMIATAIGSLAQIPGIGGGFQAMFAFVLTKLFSVTAERAVAASLLAWFFSYVPTIGVTALYLFVQGMSFKDLRTEASQS